MDTVTDAKGRVIGIRKLSVLDQVRILRAVGAAQSQNQPYIGIVQAACMAADIDGVPVPMPQTEAQIDALLTKLDNEGLAALSVRMMSEIQAATKAIEDAAENPTQAPAQ